MNTIKTVAKKAIKSIKRASPTILAVTGSIGVGVTSFLSGQAAVKADKKIRILKRTVPTNNGHVRYRRPDEKVTPIEYVQGLWRIYIPPMIAGASTIACIMGSNALNKKQQASLVSAYMMLESSYKEYKKKASEIFGPDADTKIKDAIKENASNRPASSYSDDKKLFYDTYGERYFERTLAEVVDAEYCLDRNFVLRGYADLNEFYEFLGLPKISIGSKIGWSTGAGFEFYGYEWIDFEHLQTVMDDGLECFIIQYPFEPSEDYMNY